MENVYWVIGVLIIIIIVLAYFLNKVSYVLTEEYQEAMSGSKLVEKAISKSIEKSMDKYVEKINKLNKKVDKDIDKPQEIK